MKWSHEQDGALCMVDDWLNCSSQLVFRLFGYAGSGKSTLAHEIGMNWRGTAFCAPTGKAADVLRKRGCDPVSTIHKLIYDSRPDHNGHSFRHDLKTRSDLADVSLIVVDEVSMVGGRLARDLLSFRIPILVLGDPMQLPPVGEEGFFMQARPDVQLEDIHRQAEENAIMRMADEVRRGRYLWSPGDYDEVLIKRKGSVALAAGHDTVLCGRNVTRRAWNHDLRRHHGFVQSQDYRDPQSGELLVCLKNDYSVNDPIYNGQLWRVHHVAPDSVVSHGGKWLPRLGLELRNDAARTNVRVPIACFSEGLENVPRGSQAFDFGSALTVHKAQGSEWDRVLLVDECEMFREQARRWLYTAITRASKHLTIINGY
jgi:exodeoxyribonuclease-5